MRKKPIVPLYSCSVLFLNQFQASHRLLRHRCRGPLSAVRSVHRDQEGAGQVDAQEQHQAVVEGRLEGFLRGVPQHWWSPQGVYAISAGVEAEDVGHLRVRKHEPRPQESQRASHQEDNQQQETNFVIWHYLYDYLQNCKTIDWNWFLKSNWYLSKFGKFTGVY